MNKVINKIKLFVRNDDKSKQVAKKLKEKLLLNHFQITDKDYELAVSVGGDGTFLKMVKEEKFNNKIYYVGINSGTLGFLQEIDLDKTDDFVERLKINDFKIEELSIEKTIVHCKDKSFSYYSLNEMVVRKSDLSLLKTSIYVDDELLENFTGDGLLISTSTGSTAYNMSFNGPIIYNSLKALSITPIAPLNNKIYHTLTNSVIIPENKKIKINGDLDSIFLMIDGNNVILNNVISIETMIADVKIKCLRMNDFHFIKIIKNKIL